LPRDLSEVLHYFMPELGHEEGSPAMLGPAAPARTEDVRPGLPRESPMRVRPTSGRATQEARRTARKNLSLLPIVTMPIGDGDVVRAAFAWNLAVEVARLGGRAVLITPDRDDPSPLWPEAGIGPLGAELMPAPARDLTSLYRTAVDTAVSRADGATDGGLVLVHVPPEWLHNPGSGSPLLRWTLLFTTSHAQDLRETYAIAKLVLGSNPQAQVGITIHGARGRAEAEAAFSRLAQAVQRCLSRDLLSYGLLVDDLHVYRAIVAQRPIGLEHPQSPAARALRDVAQMLLDDARKHTLA